MNRQARGYTLVELIVIILMIAIGTTLILSIHTKLQREKLDVDDDNNMHTLAQKLTNYASSYNLCYPSVEAFSSEPDRASRFADFRQRPAKALRLLFRFGRGGGVPDLQSEQTDIKMLYSPLDGAMPNFISESMLNNTALVDKDTMCFSSYAYDPGHRKPDKTQGFGGDGSTIIFGHSPSFLLRHGRKFARVITANGQVLNLYMKPNRSAYELEVTVRENTPSGPQTKIVMDDIYQDQVDALYNRDSYLSDAIPLMP